MKKVIKVNLGVVMALFAAFGLMSFKLNSGKKLNDGWYPVVNDVVQISSGPQGDPGENCQTIIPDETCAIFWPESGSLPPEDKDEALETEGTIEAFRDLE